jgi:hypothetical protein
MKRIGLASIALLVSTQVAVAQSADGQPPHAYVGAPISPPPPPASHRAAGTILGAIVGAFAGGVIGAMLNPAKEDDQVADGYGIAVGVALGAPLGGIIGWAIGGRETTTVPQPAARPLAAPQPPREAFAPVVAASSVPVAETSSFAEAAILAGQVAGGAAASVVVFATLVLRDDQGSSDSIVGSTAVLAPAATGLAVCSIGHFSVYEAGCRYSLLGAYLGILAGGALGYALAPHSDDGSGEIVAYVGGGALLGTVGATVGWQLAKRPRAARGAVPSAAAPLLPPPVAEAWPELRRRPAIGGSSEPGIHRLMFPVLALTF